MDGESAATGELHEHLKIKQMPLYELGGSPSLYEEDHLIPLELGGAAHNPKNLWPEPRTQARISDPLETKRSVLSVRGSPRSRRRGRRFGSSSSRTADPFSAGRVVSAHRRRRLFVRAVVPLGRRRRARARGEEGRRSSTRANPLDNLAYLRSISPKSCRSGRSSITGSPSPRSRVSSYWFRRPRRLRRMYPAFCRSLSSR
jgi:hypothetical protein